MMAKFFKSFQISYKINSCCQFSMWPCSSFLSSIIWFCSKTWIILFQTQVPQRCSWRHPGRNAWARKGSQAHHQQPTPRTYYILTIFIIHPWWLLLINHCQVIGDFDQRSKVSNSSESERVKRWNYLLLLEGGYQKKFILEYDPMDIEKSKETGRSDLKTTQKWNFVLIEGHRIWHQIFAGCPEFGIKSSGGVLNLASEFLGVSSNLNLNLRCQAH